MRATRGASSTSGAVGRRPQTRNQPAVYEDFTPLIENVEEDSSRNVLIHLPGFMKEQLRILAESSRRILRVRGERLVQGNKCARFQEEIPVPQDCPITEIRAKYERGILRITMPRKIPAATAIADDLPLPPPQSVAPPSPPPPPPPPPQRYEEPEHIQHPSPPLPSPPPPPPQIEKPITPPRFSPQRPMSPRIHNSPTPPPPPLPRVLQQSPHPLVLPQTLQQHQQQLQADVDHDQFHEPAADFTQENQAEAHKTSPPKIVLRPRPATDSLPQQGSQTTFTSSADQEDNHRIPHHQPEFPPSQGQDDLYLTQLERLLADSHQSPPGRVLKDGGGEGGGNHDQEMTTRRRPGRRGVDHLDEGFIKAPVAAAATRPSLKESTVDGAVYRNGWKWRLTEERQLAVNAGVAILVAFSLGAYISYSLLSSGESTN